MTTGPEGATPSDPFTAIAEGAAQMHELYLSWVGAGFTPDQSLYLLGVMLTATMRPGPPPV